MIEMKVVKILNTDIKFNNAKRMGLNVLLFTFVYAIMGGVKGIVGDSFRSYLRIINPTVSRELSMFIGFAMIILVISLLAIRKIGYKKVLIMIAALMILGFISSLYTKNYYILGVSTMLLQLGDKAFDIIMALVFMSYTTSNNRIITFTKAIILNVAFSAFITMFDGKVVVYRFKQLLGISYDKANALTTHTALLNTNELTKYLNSFRFVIWIAIAFIIVAIILLSFMKEKKEDFSTSPEEIKQQVINVKQSFDFSILKNKYIIAWIVYSTLMGIESNLVTPNLAIYFNRILHISRGTTSTILSVQSIGMLVFLLLAPYTVKKMGNIKSFAMFIFLSGPVMIIMGLGNFFLPFTAVVMGASIFFRYGFTHAVHPVQDSLQLLLVKKENRPIFVAIITSLNSIISIVIGYFGSKTLFTSIHGYHILFFGFAIVYMLCGILIYLVYNKRYNKSLY